MAIQVDGADMIGFGNSAAFADTGTPALGPAPSAAPQSAPARDFDLSPIAGLKDSARFGDNLVSDIKSSYQTYISGSAVGRGGEYATSAARKYGVSIREAAAGYLQAAGLTFLADVVSPTPTTPAPTTPTTPTTPAPNDPAAPDNRPSPVELLLDALPRLFGESVYNPPLETQSTSYTPVETGIPGESGGGGLTTFLILGALAAAGYFIYKKVKGA